MEMLIVSGAEFAGILLAWLLLLLGLTLEGTLSKDLRSSGPKRGPHKHPDSDFLEAPYRS